MEHGQADKGNPLTARDTESLESASAVDISHRRGILQTGDGVRLAWQTWTPTNPRAVIVLVHGMAEYSSRYRETACYLAAEGIAIITGDLRGHGLSEDGSHPGRVHVDQFTDYFHDVEALLRHAEERHKGLPLFILGHSMGGLISLSYSLERPQKLNGAIISSPALGSHPDIRPPLLLQWLVNAFSRLTPRLKFNSNLDNNALCRDPLVVKACNEDPLISHTVSARWFVELLAAMKRAHTGASGLRIPMLLMQSGADRVVDPTATIKWADAAPPSEVELVVWDGLYHEMFNEPEKEQVREKVLLWLDRQLTKPNTAQAPNPGQERE